LIDLNLPIGLILLALLGVGFLIYGLVVLFTNQNLVQGRIQRYVAPPQTIVKRTPTLQQGSRLGNIRAVLNSVIANLGSQETHLKLASANWPVTTGEYILLRFFSAILAFVIGRLLINTVIAGILLAIVVYSLPEVLLRRSIHQRRIKFQDQLIDVLMLIMGSVRAGQSVLQALDVLVNEIKPPASEEFRRVRREVELGVPFTQAMTNLANRMDSADLNLVVTSININTQVGGNLSTMLKAVTDTIRDRVRLFNEVRVLTSYARYSGILLSILPVITTALLYFLNPSYYDDILAPGGPKILLIIPVILIILGNIAIRRLSQIKF
jgi:tight adherence protein B